MTWVNYTQRDTWILYYSRLW